MIQIKLKDKRLSNRWEQMVRAHLRVASSAGAEGLPKRGTRCVFAVTQASWPFLNNDRITFEELIVPLRDLARIQCESIQSPFLLVAHDWSELSYPSKTTRQDLAELSSSGDFGYELTSALAINPDDGLPMAPLEMHLKTSTGLLSTRGNVQETGHIDQVLATMQASANWNLPRPIVHVIDREVDSVGHFREWDAAGQKFLVCADDWQVLYQGQKVKLSDIREQFVEQDKFKPAGTVVCDNRPGKLEIAEVEVTLDRPDRKFVKKVRGDVLDEPLPLRLVLTRVLDDQQDVSAQWCLLSNVPTEWADSKRLADSYL